MRRVAFLLALLLLVETSAYADGKRWSRMLDDSFKLLKNHDYEGSKKISRKVVAEMMDSLGPGDAAANALATVVIHRAVAEAGLGNDDDAVWYRSVARGLNPSLAKVSFAPFGEAGLRLGKLEGETTPSQNTGDAGVNGPKVPRSGDAGVEGPRIRKRVEPRYPYGALSYAQGGVLILELLIDEQGRTKRPVVLKPLPAPTLTLAALEAVRQWTFEPATIDGKPVLVVFNLTINYKVIP